MYLFRALPVHPLRRSLHENMMPEIQEPKTEIRQKVPAIPTGLGLGFRV